jgi:DNA-binding transcriptional LysR family regulator
VTSRAGDTSTAAQATGVQHLFVVSHNQWLCQAGGVDLDLGQVRAFVVVADVGNATRAAADLHLTQQALSKRIGRLEATVGVLFERTVTGMALTERGRAFLAPARDLLAAADSAVAVAQELPSQPLRVDVWGERHPVATLVRSFALTRPDLVVEYSARRSLPQALSALGRRELHLATGNLTGIDAPLPPGLTSTLVTSTAVAALLDIRHPLAGCAELSPDDLRRCRLWWPQAGSSAELSRFVDDYLTSHDLALATTGPNTADRDDLVRGVRADPTTVTFVDPGWPLDPGAGVRVVPIRPTPHYPWYVVWPRTAAHPVVPALVAHLRRSGRVPDPAAEAVWVPGSRQQSPGHREA